MHSAKHRRKISSDKHSSADLLLKNAKKKSKDKMQETINEVLAPKTISSGFNTRKEIKSEGPKFKTEEIFKIREKMIMQKTNSKEAFGSETSLGLGSRNRFSSSLFIPKEIDGEDSPILTRDRFSEIKEYSKSPQQSSFPITQKYKRRNKSAKVLKEENHSKNLNFLGNSEELIKFCNNYIDESTSIKQ
jgi:hypothetical protein